MDSIGENALNNHLFQREDSSTILSISYYYDLTEVTRHPLPYHTTTTVLDAVFQYRTLHGTIS